MCDSLAFKVCLLAAARSCTLAGGLCLKTLCPLQVEDWSPGLMRLENRHKENSLVLFFVIDSQTRVRLPLQSSACRPAELLVRVGCPRCLAAWRMALPLPGPIAPSESLPS